MIAAGAAIPAILPPVKAGGRHLMDGDVANNEPISRAVTPGADRVFVLPTGYVCGPAAPLTADSSSLRQRSVSGTSVSMSGMTSPSAT